MSHGAVWRRLAFKRGVATELDELVTAVNSIETDPELKRACEAVIARLMAAVNMNEQKRSELSE